MILELHCTPKADIYSFGILLWELVTQVKPNLHVS